MQQAMVFFPTQIAFGTPCQLSAIRWEAARYALAWRCSRRCEPPRTRSACFGAARASPPDDVIRFMGISICACCVSRSVNSYAS